MDQDYDEVSLNSTQMQNNSLYLEIKPNSNSSSISEQNYHKVLLTKTLELAISISLLLFSILFYYLSGLQQPSNAYFTYNFPTFILLSHALDRNNMFLLCNVILVFLVGYRRFVTPSSSTSYSVLEGCAGEPLPHHNYDQVQVISVTHNEDLSVDEEEHDISNRYEKRGREKEEVLKEEEESKRDVLLTKEIDEVRRESRREEDYDVGVLDEEIAVLDESREEDTGSYENGVSKLVGEGEQGIGEPREGGGLEEDYDEVGVDKEIAVDESREEDAGSYECEYNNLVGGGEQGGELLISGRIIDTDELNNKIEEFIRKMKQELKLEAHKQQLIAA